MGTFRAIRILAAFSTLTLPLMPIQAFLLCVAPSAARRFPHWYHKKVCRLLGVKLSIDGTVAGDRPVLLVSNHSSWLDIPVLSAVAPLSFVAKKEVGTWPFISWLAKLQRSIFVDRTRRQSAGDATEEIVTRLQQRDVVVLFAEGTSNDGNRVLPFKTSLFGVVEHLKNGSGASDVVIQTAAVVYTHVHGIPVSRADRPTIGWYGDMEMLSHAWNVLKSGPLNATIVINPPQAVSVFKDRKDLALSSEREVRKTVLAIQRHKIGNSGLIPVEPDADARRMASVLPVRIGEKWT